MTLQASESQGLPQRAQTGTSGELEFAMTAHLLRGARRLSNLAWPEGSLQDEDQDIVVCVRCVWKHADGMTGVALEGVGPKNRTFARAQSASVFSDLCRSRDR